MTAGNRKRFVYPVPSVRIANTAPLPVTEPSLPVPYNVSPDRTSITYLPVPLWLNEGVAQRLERVIAGVSPPRLRTDSNDSWAAAINWHPPLMWDELAERHHAFWNDQNIQEFWAGTSFNQPGEPRELSYSLAEVLAHLLGENRDAFLAFLSHAHYDDAGQTAALDYLGTNLGDAVGTFLGPGNWRPYRRAIVQRSEAQGAARSEDPENEANRRPGSRLPANHRELLFRP